MKLAVIALSLVAVAAPAVAQDHSGHTMPAAAPAATAKFTLDTPIETIVADPKGKAVIDANLPGTTTHEMYEMFKGMSLNQLAPMSQGKITPEALAKTGAALAAIN